jgi:excisionase family DNA binding protein
LTTEDVATRLDYTPEHVRRLLRAGSIPALRRGKIWYVWADDLIGLIGLPDQTTPPLDA